MRTNNQGKFAQRWLKRCAGFAGGLMTALLAAAPAQSQVGGYPEGTYPAPPEMGQFDHNEMATFGVDPAKEQIGPPIGPSQYFGLRQTNHWNSYLLRDKEGNFYLNTPNIQKVNDGDPWTAGPSFGGMGVKGSGVLGADPCARIWVGALLTEKVTANGDLQRSILDSNGNTQTWTFGPKNYRWVSTDSNFLNLSGTLATPGFNFLLPWKDPSGSTDQMYYAGQMYKVSGIYCGKAVHGYVYDEHVYSKSGYLQSWWVQQRIGYWDVYINSYSNGDAEFGHIQCGQFGEAGGVIVNRAGEKVLDTVHVKVKQVEDGSYVYSFPDGRKQRFIPEFGAFGSVVNIGDKRTIVDSIAIQQQQNGQGPTCGSLPEKHPTWGERPKWDDEDE
jgi:hypothetical protein